MTQKLTVAERLAADTATVTLATIAARSEWDQHTVEQAVLWVGQHHTEWSCNKIRDVLPEMGHGFLGAAISSLRAGGIIEHTDQYVPSTQPSTHGHRIAVWRLSAEGRRIVRTRGIDPARQQVAA